LASRHPVVQPSGTRLKIATGSPRNLLQLVTE
jgi:hypothetical protein